MAKINITLDLRSDRERRHREYMERKRLDEIRLAAARAARAAQFALEPLPEAAQEFIGCGDPTYRVGGSI